jgi:PPIC-type PPIASE domain
MMSCSARLAKIWLKEPLLHFLFLGVMLFAAYQWFGNHAEDPAKATREISVSQGRIHSLTETFARLWNRSPTQEELDGLIRDYVREEVMYREALALGLDRDDAIVRRRLQQKLEFLSDDLVMTGEPTEQELDEFLTQHPESFRRETRLTFSQVFLNPERRGASLEADTTQLLAKLNAQSSTLDLISLSDSRMLDPRLDEASQSEIVKQFGAEFASELLTLPLGRWQGPVKSGYGLHLVRVEERTLGYLPPLAEVRDAVAREWAEMKRREMKEAHYQALLTRYTVTVEQPHSIDDRSAAVAEVE